ncbi:DUF6448 family protein [Intestinirhabdus alba]|uniref:Uncharacterized protein n=1 Tax=Intestinirhabdus alba TaxID=2899544 RepID=A0A6L6IIV6_9ENTR|nr:hypothetical protein [Intestinirhabdus alba]
MKKQKKIRTTLCASIMLLAGMAVSTTAFAHCDSLDGPVLTEAKSALQARDVTPLLKWVPENREDAVRKAFDEAMSQQGGSQTSQEKARQHLFTTLVRIHREAEGASFTGVKPADHIPAVVQEADAALSANSVDSLVAKVTANVEHAIREKFAKAQHSKQLANQSVKQGREYVNDYIHYVHFVEKVNGLAAGKSSDTAHQH